MVRPPVAFFDYNTISGTKKTTENFAKEIRFFLAKSPVGVPPADRKQKRRPAGLLYARFSFVSKPSKKAS
jgi:hypothetical protein